MLCLLKCSKFQLHHKVLLKALQCKSIFLIFSQSHWPVIFERCSQNCYQQVMYSVIMFSYFYSFIYKFQYIQIIKLKVRLLMIMFTDQNCYQLLVDQQYLQLLAIISFSRKARAIIGKLPISLNIQQHAWHYAMIQYPLCLRQTKPRATILSACFKTNSHVSTQLNQMVRMEI